MGVCLPSIARTRGEQRRRSRGTPSWSSRRRFPTTTPALSTSGAPVTPPTASTPSCPKCESRADRSSGTRSTNRGTSWTCTGVRPPRAPHGRDDLPQVVHVAAPVVLRDVHHGEHSMRRLGQAAGARAGRHVQDRVADVQPDPQPAHGPGRRRRFRARSRPTRRTSAGSVSGARAERGRRRRRQARKTDGVRHGRARGPGRRASRCRERDRPRRCCRTCASASSRRRSSTRTSARGYAAVGRQGYEHHRINHSERRLRERRRAHEHDRGILVAGEARHPRDASRRLRQAAAGVPERVRLAVQPPRRPAVDVRATSSSGRLAAYGLRPAAWRWRPGRPRRSHDSAPGS